MSRDMNFSELSMKDGGARDVDPDLFLFTLTDFFGAIGDKGRWFMNIRFLKGRERVQMVSEIEKKYHRGHLYCPRIVRLRLRGPPRVNERTQGFA